MATIRDVAREAGVSIATVSRVFNDSSLVRGETRHLVRGVAERLSYWPNEVARSLITSRTRTLGVLLPEIRGTGCAGVLHAIHLAARRSGFHLRVSSAAPGGEPMTGALRSLSGLVDGVLIVAPDIESAAVIRELAGRRPVLLIGPGRDVAECHTLSIGNAEGAHRMVRHLVGLGHRRIAVIRGPERDADAAERLLGCHAALREAGIERDPELEWAGDFTADSGREAAGEILQLPARPTAVFAVNDHMAIGAMSGFHHGGCRVPQDIAVAGFGDVALARYTLPPLSTVRVDTALLGERAVGLLLRVIGQALPGARHHEVLPATPVIRGSCGAPGGSVRP